MNTQKLFLPSVVLLCLFLFTQCKEDETLNQKAGTLTLKITDAASDDEDIQAIFITVADVKVDGKPIRNFDPLTIELSSLRNGLSQVLASKELAAKEYGQISLILASGNIDAENTPACYVVTQNNLKHNLLDSVSTNIEIPVSKSFELLPGEITNMIIDFDLRKAIVRKTSGTNKYSFVTPSELKNAVRLVNEDTSGTITGHVKAKDLENNHIYVYVYRKGEFQASAEGTGSGKSKVLFANSIASALVQPDGSYMIPYIEEGEYDLRLASFRRNRDNLFTFEGFVRTTSKRTGMLLNYVSVAAGAETTINIEVFSLY